MHGYIYLHRKLRENPMYSNSVAIHCWIECLFRATYQENTVFLRRQKVALKPGQFCMGRDEFAKRLGISPSTAYFWLNQFKLDSMIDIKTTNKGSVVTILKWNEYQLLDSKLDNRKTAEKQQKNTNNTVNTVNTDNKEKEKEKINTNVFIQKKEMGVNELIALFEFVNPSWQELFKNKTQRACMERMIKEHGTERIKQAIQALTYTNGQPYAPIITTPFELEKKMGALMAYLQRSQKPDYKFSVLKL